MSHRDPAHIVSQQLHALAARGVERFPRPTTTFILEDEPVALAPQPSPPRPHGAPGEAPGPQTPPAPRLTPQTLAKAIEGCQRCPLSQQRKRVVAEPDFTPRAILVVSDFPGPEDEEARRPFTHASSRHKILQNLLAKVGQEVHRSFAIKCAPRKGIPNETAAACANHLTAEIEMVSPRVVWCFGHRALRAVELALGTRFFDAPEIGLVGKVPFAGRQIEVVALPSSRELEAHAEWRFAVWEVLKGFLARN